MTSSTFFYNMEGSVSTVGTDLLIFMNAIHLVCIAVSSWAIANEGTDKLCRYMMTAILLCCSIPQCFWYVTKDCLAPGGMVFTFMFQGGFLFISKHCRAQGMVLASIERFERKIATETLLHFYNIDIIIAI